MSEWYYQQERCLGGPVSFTRLARLVVDDELAESDVVSRADEVNWVPIKSVVGLRQTCDVLAGRREYLAPAAADVDGSQVAQLTPEEARQRKLDAAYHRLVNGSENVDPEARVSRRDALIVWGPVSLIAASLLGVAAYEMLRDPWANRTYDRGDDDD